MAIVTAAVTYKKQDDGRDFVKIGLEGGLNFIINESDPILKKFLKGYILTVEVSSFDAGFSKPKDEHTKSLKALLDWIKGLKGFVNCRGVVIKGIERPASSDLNLDELPDVDNSITAATNNVSHLIVVGRV